MRSFNLSCLIVERKYVLLVELAAGITKTSFNTFTTSDSKSRSLLVIPRMYSNTSLKTASSIFRHIQILWQTVSTDIEDWLRECPHDRIPTPA